MKVYRVKVVSKEFISIIQGGSHWIIIIVLCLQQWLSKECQAKISHWFIYPPLGGQYSSKYYEKNWCKIDQMWWHPPSWPSFPHHIEDSRSYQGPLELDHFIVSLSFGIFLWNFIRFWHLMSSITEIFHQPLFKANYSCLLESSF